MGGSIFSIFEWACFRKYIYSDRIKPGLLSNKGVVGSDEGVVYLTSPGRPTILAYSWARPAILVAGKGRGGGGGGEDFFYFFCFLIFFSFFLFLFLPCPSLSSPLLSLPFSPFLRETTQNDPQGLMCR